MMRASLRWPFALLLLICGGGASGREAWVPEFTTEVIPLGEYARNSGRAVFSDDRNHIMDVISTKGGSRVFLDGRVAPGCDQLDVRVTAMSLDGSFFVCDGNKDGASVVVANGRAFEDLGFLLEPPVVSPKGGHWACAPSKDGKYAVYHDGRILSHYSSLPRPLRFSPDGKCLFYEVEQTVPFGQPRKVNLVVNGKAGPTFSSISRIHFSNDGEHLFYLGWQDKQMFVVMDGKVNGPYAVSNLDTLEFSPDGEHWFCVSGFSQDPSKNDPFALIDGKQIPNVGCSRMFRGLPPGDPWQDRVRPSFLISADGKQLWYYSKQGVPMLNHEPYNIPSGLKCSLPFLSPDGKRLAFVAREGDRKQMVIVDGKIGPAFQRIAADEVLFSPDGSRFAYVGRKSELQSVAVIDDYVSPVYWLIFDESLLFSRDGKRVGFVARKGGGKWVAWVDGDEGPEYPEIGENSLSFSPDSRSFAFTAATNGGPTDKTHQEYVVLNGVPGPMFDRLPGPIFRQGPVFKEDGTIEYLGARGNKLFRVRHTYATSGWQ